MQAAVLLTRSPAAPDWARLRRTMVDCQLRTFDITDAAVLEAFETVPREAFVGAENAAVAYSDAALKVGAAGRALLAPMVLARMLAGAGLKKGDRVLDIGGGLGYSAAILSQLTGSVVALESDSGLAEAAKTALAAAGCGNVTTVTGPLEAGYPQSGPFDVILVNGAVEANFRQLLDQLSPGGRLLAVARAPGQTGRAAKATRFDRLQSGVIGEKWLFDAAAATLDGFRRTPAFVF